MVGSSELKDRACVFTPVTVELTELNAGGSVEEQLACCLIGESHIRLLKGLIRIRIVDKSNASRAAYADRHLWGPIVINIKTPRKSFGADEIGIVSNVGIKFAG